MRDRVDRANYYVTHISTMRVEEPPVDYPWDFRGMLCWLRAFTERFVRLLRKQNEVNAGDLETLEALCKAITLRCEARPSAKCTILEATTRSLRSGRSRLPVAAAIVPFAVILAAILWRSAGSDLTSRSGGGQEVSPPQRDVSAPVSEGSDVAYSYLGHL